MSVVIGVDFGTLSVRVSVVDSAKGLLESSSAGYPLHRTPQDPESATQSHADHMKALASATREALKKAGIAGDQIDLVTEEFDPDRFLVEGSRINLHYVAPGAESSTGQGDVVALVKHIHQLGQQKFPRD